MSYEASRSYYEISSFAETTYGNMYYDINTPYAERHKVKISYNEKIITCFSSSLYGLNRQS